MQIKELFVVMKTFKFPLDKVLGYREQVLELEKNSLGFEIAKENEILAFIERAKGDIDRQSALLSERMGQGTTAMEVMQISQSIEGLKQKLKTYKSQLIEQQKVVQKQRGVVIKANQDHTLLEKLKEKKRAQYDHEVIKQENGIIEEFIVGAVNRG